VGGFIGSMLGVVRGQILGAHIGSRSIALSHSGTTSPFIHAHTQSAKDGEAIMQSIANKKDRICDTPNNKL